MKDFQVYYCRNDHTNFVESGKERYDCKICRSQITKVHGVLVKGESEDELSKESKYDRSSE